MRVLVRLPQSEDDRLPQDLHRQQSLLQRSHDVGIVSFGRSLKYFLFFNSNFNNLKITNECIKIQLLVAIFFLYVHVGQLAKRTQQSSWWFLFYCCEYWILMYRTRGILSFTMSNYISVLVNLLSL